MTSLSLSLSHFLIHALSHFYSHSHTHALVGGSSYYTLSLSFVRIILFLLTFLVHKRTLAFASLTPPSLSHTHTQAVILHHSNGEGHWEGGATSLGMDHTGKWRVMLFLSHYFTRIHTHIPSFSVFFSINHMRTHTLALFLSLYF